MCLLVLVILLTLFWGGGGGSMFKKKAEEIVIVQGKERKNYHIKFFLRLWFTVGSYMNAPPPNTDTHTHTHAHTHTHTHTHTVSFQFVSQLMSRVPDQWPRQINGSTLSSDLHNGRKTTIVCSNCLDFLDFYALNYPKKVCSWFYQDFKSRVVTLVSSWRRSDVMSCHRTEVTKQREVISVLKR